jgi:hypothetical protein
MTRPRVIALAATRNRPEWAHRAAHFFFDQVYDGPKTLYIYDDGDADRGVALCSALRANFDLVYVKHEPIKLPVKRNIMMRAAIAQDPDAIFFVWDDDDYHGPRQIQRQVDALLANPKADACVLCPLLWYNEPTQTLSRALKLNLHGLKLRVFTDATIAFRRRFWERSPWDEAVDPNACWRWIQEPHHVVIDIPSERDYVVVRHATNHMPDKTVARFWSTDTEGTNADEVVQWLEAPLPCA